MSEYPDYVGRLGHQPFTALAAELTPIRTLERLLDWLKLRNLDLAGALDLIQQEMNSATICLYRSASKDWLSYRLAWGDSAN